MSKTTKSPVNYVNRYTHLYLSALQKSELPLIEIREANRKCLRSIIDPVQSSKIILFDPKIIRPLGTLVDKTELKEWGVHTCLELKEYDTDILSLLQETELLDPKDVSSFTKKGLTLFFLLRAKTRQVTLAACQIKKEQNTTNAVRQYFLVFLPRATEESMAIFVQELGPNLECLFDQNKIRIYYCPVYLFPLDYDLISLELDEVFKEFHCDGDATSLMTCSEAFLQLQYFLKGLCPNFWSIGTAGKFVCNQLIRARRELQMQLPVSLEHTKIEQCFETPYTNMSGGTMTKPQSNVSPNVKHEIKKTPIFIPPIYISDTSQNESSSDIDESPSQHSSQSCKVVAKETQTGVTKENYHETLNDGISQKVSDSDVSFSTKELSSLHLKSIPEPYNRIHPYVDDVVFFDRRVDLITPFCTSLVYEALLHEFFGIEHGLISNINLITNQDYFKTAQNVKNHQKQKTMLISFDPIFSSIRNLPQDRVGIVLHDKASEIQKIYKEKESLTSIADINQFMKKFKVKQLEHSAISNHVNLLTTISSILKTDEFQNFLKLEDDIMESPNLSPAVCFDIVQQLIDSFDIQSSPSKIYQFICLLNSVNNGLKPQWIEHLTKFLCQAFGIQELLRLQCMEKAGLITINQQNMTSKNYWTCLKSTLRLIVENSKINENKSNDVESLDDISYVCSGYAPLSVRLFENLYTHPSGWQHFSNVLQLLWGPVLHIRQSLQPLSQEDASDYSNKNGTSVCQTTESSSPTEEIHPRLTLIVFLGGCTYAEVAAIRHLNQYYKPKRQFVILSTEMLNSTTIVRSFESSET